jgi:hypothetical protein
LSLQTLRSTVLSLRYYVCEGCDGVHADVDPPAVCGRCGRRGADLFDDVTTALDDSAARYFAPRPDR